MSETRKKPEKKQRVAPARHQQDVTHFFLTTRELLGETHYPAKSVRSAKSVTIAFQNKH